MSARCIIQFQKLKQHNVGSSSRTNCKNILFASNTMMEILRKLSISGKRLSSDISKSFSLFFADIQTRPKLSWSILGDSTPVQVP